MSCLLGVSPRPLTTSPFSLSAVCLVRLLGPCTAATDAARRSLVFSIGIVGEKGLYPCAPRTGREPIVPASRARSMIPTSLLAGCGPALPGAFGLRAGAAGTADRTDQLATLDQR